MGTYTIDVLGFTSVSVIKSEGSEYNIINLNKSIDGELSVDSSTQKSLNKIRTHIVEADLRSRGESLGQQTELRRIQRVSDRRRISHLQYGYLPMEKSSKAGLSAWERIMTSPSRPDDSSQGKQSLLKSVSNDTESFLSRPKMDGSSSISSISGSSANLSRQMKHRESLSIDISKVDFGDPVITKESRRAATANAIPVVRSSGFPSNSLRSLNI